MNILGRSPPINANGPNSKNGSINGITLNQKKRTKWKKY